MIFCSPFTAAEAESEDAQKEGEGEEEAERAQHEEDGQLEEEVHPDAGRKEVKLLKWLF